MIITQRNSLQRAVIVAASGIALTGAITATAMAADRIKAASQPTSGADAGAKIATQGVPGTAVAACISCHGAKGEGNAAAGFPRLAGMAPLYLQRQLAAYADGQRPHPVMTPIAKALTSTHRQAVSTYMARLDSGATASGAARQAGPPRGGTLASHGDEALQVQACANCHGPEGTGEGAVAPPLAGQHASYLKAALQAWKDGSRKTDPSGQMPSIAAALDEKDMEALAQYYAALPAASPLSSSSQSARPNGPLNKVPSGPRPAAKAKAPQGIGTEQGSPTTGGAQGPGGGGGGTGSGATGGSGGTP